MVSGFPTCPDCAKPVPAVCYPRWLKWGFAGVLLVTAASYVHSYRFICGYGAFRLGQRAMRADRNAAAGRWFRTAAARMPEENEYQVMASLYQGITLIEEDRAAEAVPLLRKARDLEPAAVDLNRILLNTELDLAFAAQDYGLALEKGRDLVKLEPGRFESLMRMAATSAARFSQTRDPELQVQAQAFLVKAKAAHQQPAGAYAEQEPWLLHRLATGKVLSLEAFQTAFPNGWRPGLESK